MISETDTGMGINRLYTYGENGKLSSINGTNPKSCHYDSKGYLDIFGSASYSYDNYGNRTSRTATGETAKSYSYTRGNLLSSMNGATYYYNAKSVRFRKINGGVTTNYYLDEDKILGEDRTDGKQLRYFYDIDGLCGVKYNDTYYTYVRNAQNDIVMIINSYMVVAKYNYDVWGNYTVDTYNDTDGIANLNPFRWKSHYYDTESGLYYANGRYYDPETGLYINASDASQILENAFDVFGLDRNGILCNNILQLERYLYAIFTALELAPDPDYNPDFNKPWWELAWNAVVKWFYDVVNWYNSLSNEIKLIAGITLFVTAIILTILSGGQLAPLFIGMAFSIGISVVIGGISSAINGTDFWQGIADGVADGIFWGGLFAFLTASVQAIKCAANAVKTARIQRNLKYAADEYMRMQKALVPLDQVDDLKFITAVYDDSLKAYTYGVNGGLRESGQSMGQQLFELGARKSCAETQAIKVALDAGSKLGNLYVYTVNRNFAMAYACRSCTNAFYGRVAAIFSGIYPF